jgi:hypothetical protein
MDKSADVIFFHSSADSELAKELIGFLKARENSKQFTMWQPAPGDDADTVTSSIKGDNLTHGARTILLFHTKNFFNDSYDENTIIQNVMPVIMQRHREKLSRVIPISLGYQSMEGAPYQELKLLAYETKPLSYWKKENLADAACDYIAEQVRQYNDKFKPGSKPPPVREAPPPADYSFLASLCNRDQQKEGLEAILNLKDKAGIKDFKKEPEKNRFACIIHGKTEEDLSGYKKRLEKNEINKILKTGRKRKVWLIDLPAPKEQSDRNNLAHYFEKTLMEKVYKGKENKKLSDVFDKLQGYKAPVIICYNFRTDHLRVSQQKKSFFNFWNRWKHTQSSNELRPQIIEPFFEYWNSAALKNSTPIITCVFFKYDKQLDGDEKLNQETQAYFEKLEFAKYPNMRGNILPKLSPIALDDVTKWVDEEKIYAYPCRHNSKKFCDDCTWKFENSVDGLYNHPSTENKVVYNYQGNIEIRIRMHTLRPFLAEQLENIIARAESAVFRN